jgi:DNA-binding IclR family transcriptional regulator
MKSLNKTFDILEHIFNRNGIPSTPYEVAASIKINAATCSRILSELLERGYIERVSRRTGYIPGPALYALSTRQSPYAHIAKAAEGHIRELAVRISSMINISVMKDGYRYVLCFHCGDEKRKFPLRTKYFQDHYTTATGRLLLSVAPEHDVDFVVGKLGFPKESWNGIGSIEAFRRELAKTARAGTVKYLQDGIWIVGALVKTKSYPPAAIGFGVATRKKADEAATLLDDTVAGIEEKLSSDNDRKTSFY